MTAASSCLLVSAAAYAGFQWTVHVVVYRQFTAVPADAFTEYERLHQRRISFVVGPLFAALVLSAAWLVVDTPIDVPAWLVLPAVGLVAVLLVVTAFAAVPQHRKLSAGWDDGAYRSLVRADLARVIVATAEVVVAIGVASR
jgi:hypothetical protein